MQHIWIYDIQPDGSVKKQKGINEAYVDMQNSENQRKRGKTNIEYKENNWSNWFIYSYYDCLIYKVIFPQKENMLEKKRKIFIFYFIGIMN